MINQEFKALGRKYQMFPYFGICCRELRGLEVTVSALSVQSKLDTLPLQVELES